MFQKNLWKRAQKEIIQQALPDNWIRIHDDRFTTYSKGDLLPLFILDIWVNFFSGQSNTKGKWPIIVPFEYKIKDRACLIYEKARARRNGAKMTGAVKPYVCVLKLMHHQPVQSQSGNGASLNRSRILSVVVSHHVVCMYNVWVGKMFSFLQAKSHESGTK